MKFGPLAAEILSLVWGTPADFNGFRVLASLLQRSRSTEVNQTLHYVWPSPGLVRYIYTFGISCPLTEFCHAQNSLCVHLCTIARFSGYIFATKASIDNWKKLVKQRYVLIDEIANVNFCAVRPRKLPEFAEITQNNRHYAVQGHSMIQGHRFGY